MMARRVYGLSIALSVMAWRVCAAQAGDDLAAVRRAIDAQNHAWEEATKAGDAAAIARIVSDSGVDGSWRILMDTGVPE
jgi:hypothetical protein